MKPVEIDPQDLVEIKDAEDLSWLDHVVALLPTVRVAVVVVLTFGGSTFVKWGCLTDEQNETLTSLLIDPENEECQPDEQYVLFLVELYSEGNIDDDTFSYCLSLIQYQ